MKLKNSKLFEKIDKLIGDQLQAGCIVKRQGRIA